MSRLCASIGSSGSGHRCFRVPRHRAITASPNVFADSKSIHRQGDKWCVFKKEM